MWGRFATCLNMTTVILPVGMHFGQFWQVKNLPHEAMNSPAQGDCHAVPFVLSHIDGTRVSIPRDTIDEMQSLKKSIMPAGLLRGMTDQQLRDLFAYLRASQPLP